MSELVNAKTTNALSPGSAEAVALSGAMLDLLTT